MICELKTIQRVKHNIPIVITNHKHLHNELTYFIYGNGTTEINNELYHYNNRTFAYYKKDTVHNETNPVPCDIIWMHFSLEKNSLVLNEGVFDDPFSEVFDILQKIRKVETERGEAAVVLREAYASELVATVYKLQRQKNYEKDFDKVAEYIDDNKNTEIDFRRLASEYNYSYDRFRHLFKERFGDSPHSYLLKLRIEQATYFLGNTNIPITEIAYETGFNSSSQFVNAFKKHINMTPGEWRRKYSN